MKGQFGVEIECVGLNIAEVCEAITQDPTKRFVDNSHTHNGPTFFDGITWQAMADGSLNNRGTDLPMNQMARWAQKGTHEIVSPVLKGNKGMKALQEVMTALRRKGAIVNKSCGQHITFDCNNSRWKRMGANKKRQTLRRLVNTYHHFSPIIDRMLAPSRRNVHWAQVRTFETSRFTKYEAVNLSKFERHGIIEFRQHQGTLNFKKAREWINFLHRIICFAVNEEHAHKNYADFDRSFDGMVECLELNEAQVAFWTQRIAELNPISA
jgi:hypothetical protein